MTKYILIDDVIYVPLEVAGPPRTEDIWEREKNQRIMNKLTSELVNKELFDKWKLDKAKEFQGTQDLCKHSAFDGMFGFSGWAGCNLHWDDGIHYGSRGCPENCPDFELADENILRERYLEDLRERKEREERLR